MFPAWRFKQSLVYSLQLYSPARKQANFFSDGQREICQLKCVYSCFLPLRYQFLGNKKSYLSQNKVKEDKLNFINCFAERYPIDSKDNKFYFFNPFSEQIFIKVVGNILDSVSNHERPVDIILYYPSDDYIYYLENYTPFSLKKEIKIPNKYEYDSREKILIYELSYLNLI